MARIDAMLETLFARRSELLDGLRCPAVDPRAAAAKLAVAAWVIWPRHRRAPARAARRLLRDRRHALPPLPRAAGDPDLVRLSEEEAATDTHSPNAPEAIREALP